MIIPDANLILYAHNQADPEHQEALTWWESLLNGHRAVGMTHEVIMAFLRLSTSARVLKAPLSVEQSCRCVESWFVAPHVRVIAPTQNHLPLFLRMVRASGIGGNLTSDAHLAAISVEYGAEIHSSDQDFNRFPDIDWRNPLKP